MPGRRVEQWGGRACRKWEAFSEWQSPILRQQRGHRDDAGDADERYNDLFLPSQSLSGIPVGPVAEHAYRQASTTPLVRFLHAFGA